ncbi:TonB-dependent receptor [Yersinia sp. 2466 StPb PI]
MNPDSSDSQLVPRTGVVYKLTPKVSLYDAYSGSFKPNLSIANQIDCHRSRGNLGRLAVK